ncbi:TetR/AcrR family transcriptional regulator [Pseudonocardia benzenivorans]|uniref:TetR/AcrR family transcriptional regulator n=1 Tax=Pseudonocardia benzenivorans TaxID=228005 RepID=A0ABW3VP49_9PSEU|nr:TetR/AcrR family transcriptional regulator [Pseudonocardia dioxanivorans]
MTEAPTLRLRMLRAAEQQLAASDDNDVSTRAVCEAVGVGQPALYRIFGDKAGLLAALVDHGFERYVERKRALETTDDPVADLRAGWDDHIAFALENPAVYRLMFSPTLTRRPEAPETIFGLLSATLERCARAGVLRLPAPLAAQRILSANVGVALAVLVRPDLYSDPQLSTSVRDAVFAACLDEPGSPDEPAGLDEPGSPGEQGRLDGQGRFREQGRSGPETAGADIGPVAIRLAAQLRAEPSSPLGDEEQQLLLKWLDLLGAGA